MSSWLLGSSSFLLCRLPQPNAGSATILLDELDVGLLLERGNRAGLGGYFAKVVISFFKRIAENWVRFAKNPLVVRSLPDARQAPHPCAALIAVDGKQLLQLVRRGPREVYPCEQLVGHLPNPHQLQRHCRWNNNLWLLNIYLQSSLAIAHCRD
jgi:hypothetical protein